MTEAIDTLATEETAGLPPQETIAPVKRGRGRPPKGESTPGAAPSNRKATTTAKKEKEAEQSAEDFAAQIMGFHLVAAKFIGPEIAISEKESFALAKSIKELSAQYDLSINPKAAASLQLLATVAIIYGPRVVMIKTRIAKEKAVKDEQPQPDTIN